ncbi:MAG: hypothetical protein K0B15_00690 [Lentimicrobium sp.]|nr:hypothetical protein [Lentimicrobium sp.]
MEKNYPLPFINLHRSSSFTDAIPLIVSGGAANPPAYEVYLQSVGNSFPLFPKNYYLNSSINPVALMATIEFYNKQ